MAEKYWRMNDLWNWVVLDEKRKTGLSAGENAFGNAFGQSAGKSAKNVMQVPEENVQGSRKKLARLWPPVLRHYT